MLFSASGGIGTRWNKGPCWESQVIGNSNVTLASIVRWNKVTYVIFYSGIEALYADLCHFPVLAIQVSGFNQKESWSMILLPQWINHVYVQIAFTLVVFPCLLLAYTGQAAYIIDHKDHVADAFYRSIPGPTELSKNLILLISRYHTTISCPICTNWHSACRTTLTVH